MSAHGIAGPRAAVAPDGDGGPDRDLRPLRTPDNGRPRHLRVVDSQPNAAQGRRRWIRVGGAVVAAVVVALLFVSVGMHAMLAQNQFRLDRLNAQAAAQQAEYHHLRLTVDQLESPQRVIAAAKGRLGMVEPGSVTYLAPSSAVSSTQATTAPADQRQSPVPPATTPGGWSDLKAQLAAKP